MVLGSTNMCHLVRSKLFVVERLIWSNRDEGMGERVKKWKIPYLLNKNPKMKVKIVHWRFEAA